MADKKLRLMDKAVKITHKNGVIEGCLMGSGFDYVEVVQEDGTITKLHQSEIVSINFERF